jgi:hypothetical protein
MTTEVGGQYGPYRRGIPRPIRGEKQEGLTPPVGEYLK